MGKQGYISINRAIQNHWLFTEKRTFSKFEAWIYLLMEANHAKGKVPIGNQLITVERGQKLTSILTLSDLFNWSRYKVKSFLDLLETDGMLKVKTTSKYTLLTIVNYDFYQSDEGRKKHQKNINPTSNQQQADINPTSNQHQTNTNNNVNKKNNDNNGNNVKKKINAFDFFQSNGFGILNQYTSQNIEMYLDAFDKDSDEIVQAALKIALDRNKVSWGYAKKILDCWTSKNLKTIEEIRAFEKQQQATRQQTNNNYSKNVKSKELTPDWLISGEHENRRGKKSEVFEDESVKRDAEAFKRQLREQWGESS